MSKNSKSFYNFTQENKRGREKKLGGGKFENSFGVEYTTQDKNLFELMDKKTTSINKLMDKIYDSLSENGFRSYYNYTNYIGYGELKNIRSNQGFKNTKEALKQERKNISTHGTGAQKSFYENYMSYVKNNFEGSKDRDLVLQYLKNLTPMELDMLRSVREDFSLRYNYTSDVGGNIKEIKKELEKYQGITYVGDKAQYNKNSPQAQVKSIMRKHNTGFSRIGKSNKRKSTKKNK